MRVAALVLVLSMTACSWAFMDKPPDPAPPPGTPIYCSTGKGAPVLDLIIAVPNGLLALLGIAVMQDGGEVGDALGGTMLITGGVTALIYGLSARSGFKYADRCRELKIRQYQQMYAPPQQPYPPRRHY